MLEKIEGPINKTHIKSDKDYQTLSIDEDSHARVAAAAFITGDTDATNYHAWHAVAANRAIREAVYA